MGFLEMVMTARMKALHFAGDYAGVTHAGLAMVAADTGRVLLAKRADDPADEPGARGKWEFPGGGIDTDDPFTGAVREFIEETGLALPEGEVINGWRANEVYQGFVYAIPTEFAVDEWTPTTEVADIGWFDSNAVQGLENAGAMREEIVATMNWSLVFPETEEETMTAAVEDVPDGDYSDVFASPIPIHGVLAPEDVPTGDKRGFLGGSMTARPYRLPFRWQETDIGGHDGARVVGSVDRLMRKDGLIHWDGLMMPSPKADEFTGLMEFFGGRYGVSVDGDNGTLNPERSEADGMAWFDAVRASGLTAVDIPAFSEAYVAFGPHPDMPAETDEQYAVMTASGDLVAFARGPGWVTNPKDTKRIHDYWTKKGEPGYAKIAWGTPGDFRRAKSLIGEKIAKNSPEKMRFLNQIIAQWHFDALGYWPGDLGKPGNAPDTPENRRRAAIHADASGEVEEFREVSSEERKRLADSGAAMPDGSFPIANCDDLKNAIQAIGRAKDPAATKAHIRKRKSALGCTDVDLPETWANEAVWEAVLVSSAGTQVYPPASYFTRHPDTDALVIEDPDESGIRRTYGYAGEWGVCHIGFEGRCIEVPSGGDYPEFHLGITKTAEGERIKTGLITYGVKHRSAAQILSESATQANFDDLSHAWAAVVLGEDERGVWFSGVVLPTVEEKWLTTIQASGQVSGEWKHGFLRTLLTVNVPGFPVMRSSAVYDDEGNIEALAASALTAAYRVAEPPEDAHCMAEGCTAPATWGVWQNPTFAHLFCADHVEAAQEAAHYCEEDPTVETNETPTPAERMAALASIDAEVRMTSLRSKWEAR